MASITWSPPLPRDDTYVTAKLNVQNKCSLYYDMHWISAFKYESALAMGKCKEFNCSVR
jgi:hypothetical protein